MSPRAAAAAGQFDILDLIPIEDVRPSIEDDAPCVPGPVLGVAHAGRHLLWSWRLVWALDGRRDVLRRTLIRGGGDCDVCGWWEHHGGGVKLASNVDGYADRRGITPVRHTIAAVLAELDRRAAARPDLVARVLELGTAGYDPARAVLADELWGTR